MVESEAKAAKLLSFVKRRNYRTDSEACQCDNRRADVGVTTFGKKEDVGVEVPT